MLSTIILGLCTAASAFVIAPQLALRDANFDDLAVIPGSGDLQPVPAGYMGLNYEGFFLNQPGVAGVVAVGLEPHSWPNFASNNILEGNLAIEITTRDTQTNFFNFAQFYFGCTANTVVNAVGVVEACTVQVTGSYKGVSNAFLQEQFTFVPTNVGAMTPMQQANVNAVFAASPVDFVSFQVIASSGVLGNTQLFLDDLIYSTNSQ